MEPITDRKRINALLLEWHGDYVYVHFNADKLRVAIYGEMTRDVPYETDTDIWFHVTTGLELPGALYQFKRSAIKALLTDPLPMIWLSDIDMNVVRSAVDLASRLKSSEIVSL